MSFLDNFKEGTGWAVAAQAAPGIISMFQAQSAKKNYQAKIDQIEKFQRQDIINPYENMENPYKNLSVATNAAKMQAEESDIALANTLDTLRETGKGAGGATAIAQAALKSKQNVASSIEKQEVNNEKLKAQGQLQVDVIKGKGELARQQMQETREIGELDRLQSEADLAKAQQLQSRYGGLAALGKGLQTLGANVLPPQTGDETESSLAAGALGSGSGELDAGSFVQDQYGGTSRSVNDTVTNNMSLGVDTSFGSSNYRPLVDASSPVDIGSNLNMLSQVDNTSSSNNAIERSAFSADQLSKFLNYRASNNNLSNAEVLEALGLDPSKYLKNN